MGWFACESEWYESNDKGFAQSEAQSVSLVVHHLLNEKMDAVSTLSTDSSLKGKGCESELNNLVTSLRY